MTFISLTASDGNQIKVNASSILYFGDGFVHLLDGSRISVSHNMSDIDSEIYDASFFTGKDNYDNTISISRSQMHYAVIAPAEIDEDGSEDKLAGVTVVGIQGASIPVGNVAIKSVVSNI